MTDKIVELGAHAPSVESVITRLYRMMDSIKHITAIIEYNDGSSSVCCNTKDLSILCYEKEVLSKLIAREIKYD